MEKKFTTSDLANIPGGKNNVLLNDKIDFIGKRSDDNM